MGVRGGFMASAGPPWGSGTASSRVSGCTGQLRGGVEAAQDLLPLHVGHGGGEERLELGLAPAPVPGPVHAQVLKMVDLALHLGATPQQGLDLGVCLGGPSSSDAGLVHAGGDAAATLLGLGAALPQRAGGADLGREDEQQGGPALVIGAGTGIGGGAPSGAGGRGSFEV